jgi:hypothetical protein
MTSLLLNEDLTVASRLETTRSLDRVRQASHRELGRDNKGIQTRGAKRFRRLLLRPVQSQRLENHVKMLMT